MKRPDYTFRIEVHPVFRVFSCAAKLAEEARGLYGFHGYTSCPHCRVEPTGYELWGENGHCQGTAPDRARLAGLLRWKVQQQWVAKGDGYYPRGAVIGYRFYGCGPIYYEGGAA